MDPFVKATHKLEGDGPLSLEAYQQLSILFASVSTQHYPNVAAVAKAEANGNASHKQQLLDYSKACVQPAYDYFYLIFNNDLKPVLDVFKPMYMAASEDVSTEIDLIAWWKRHAIELPKWANAFKKVLLVQPSSTAAERFFSILQRFTAQ